MKTKDIKEETIIKGIKKYFEEHPEIIYKAIISSGILQNVATKDDLKLIIEFMEKRFEAMDKRFEAMDKRFEVMEKRIEVMEKSNQQRFEALEKRLNFIQWLIGIGFAFLGSLITVINLIGK